MFKKLPKQILSLLFIFLCNILYCQTPVIDSLKNEIDSVHTESEKLRLILELCEQRHSLSSDTLYHYASLAERLSRSLKNNHGLILSQYYYMYYLIKKGSIDSALSICDQYIIMLYNNRNEEKLYLHLLGTKGGLLIKLNRYKESFSTYYKLLNESEKVNDTLNELSAYNGLGWVNMEMDKNNDALKFFDIAVRNPAVKNTEGYGAYYSFIFSNMASVYNSIKKNDSAEHYINKAIALAERFENLTSLANALAIKADIMSDTRRNKDAENLLLRVINIRKQIGDPYFIVSDISQLAVYYYHNSQPEKGIATALQGIDMAVKNNLSSKLPLLYDALAQSYKAAGDYKMYSETLRKIISLKDSLYEKNSAEALAEVQGKYEAQKKENTIAQQKLNIIKSSNLFYGTLSFLIFIMVLSAVLFFSYRKRQLLKARLLQEEEKRQSEIAVNNAAEKERKRIAADLHDNMGAYATAIIANVDDMMVNKNIYNEPAFTTLKTNAGELMSNLRDTIWASNKERISLINVSDRFKIYIRKIVKAYPQVNIDITEAISYNPFFSPVQALNIFRILQEACTNALKHSNTKDIYIHFQSEKNFCINISDKGTGIISENYIDNGNGINNMRLRAQEAGLHFSIQQNQPGVTIKIASEEILHI